MKQTLKNIIGTLSLSAVALTASAQVPGDSSPTTTTTLEQSQEPEQIRDSAADNPSEQVSGAIGAVKSAEFIGMEIANLQGEELGSVHEIAVDVESGRIVGVILSTGGFLGIGASETVVPPGAFVLDRKTQQIRMDTGKQQLLDAPRFDTSEWSEAFTIERLSSVYRHFGLESSFDFVKEGEQVRKAFTFPESRLNQIQRGSEIPGMKVVTLKDEAVGDVSELMLDLPAGRITALVVATGEFLGIDGELSAIPASSFRFSTDRETLQINTNRVALTEAPHFQEDRWPDFTKAETIDVIYSAHSAEPYDRADAPAQRITAIGSGQDAGGTPTQGGSEADMATTSAIRNEIRALENISLNARNASVVTNEGLTTLSGPIDTAGEKQMLGEIANRNNPEAEVDNLLVVKVAKTNAE